jgi:hypothetical protein
MKSNSIKTAFGILMLVLFTSCNFSSTYLNREEDKNDAEKVSTKLYTFLENKDYKQLHKLISKRFWETTNPAKLDEFLQAVNNRLGMVKHKNLDHWETKVIIGSKPSSTYVLYYLVQREKFVAQETVTLTKENDEIKILGYNVNSEGLFK